MYIIFYHILPVYNRYYPVQNRPPRHKRSMVQDIAGPRTLSGFAEKITNLPCII